MKPDNPPQSHLERAKKLEEGPDIAKTDIILACHVILIICFIAVAVMAWVFYGIGLILIFSLFICTGALMQPPLYLFYLEPKWRKERIDYLRQPYHLTGYTQRFSVITPPKNSVITIDFLIASTDETKVTRATIEAEAYINRYILEHPVTKTVYQQLEQELDPIFDKVFHDVQVWTFKIRTIEPPLPISAGDDDSIYG